MCQLYSSVLFQTEELLLHKSLFCRLRSAGRLMPASEEVNRSFISCFCAWNPLWDCWLPNYPWKICRAPMHIWYSRRKINYDIIPISLTRNCLFLYVHKTTIKVFCNDHLPIFGHYITLMSTYIHLLHYIHIYI